MFTFFIFEGKSRSAHSLRPTSPKSPVASASAFESIEGSDEEDTITDTAKLDTAYLHTNGDAVLEFLDLLYYSTNSPPPPSSPLLRHTQKPSYIVLSESKYISCHRKIYFKVS